MVVRDNQVHPQRLGLGSGGKRPNARIHADDQPDPSRRCIAQHARLHPVALAQAMRHMIGHTRRSVFGRDAFDGGLQQHRCGRSIDVVVAIDQDRLTVPHGALNPGHSDVHAKHLHGVDQVVDVRD